MMQSSQPVNQHQLQQQLMFQAQQNLTSPSANDLECRKLRMLLSNRNMGLGKDSPLNSVGDVIPNVPAAMQASSSVLPRGSADMLMQVSSCVCFKAELSTIIT